MHQRLRKTLQSLQALDPARGLEQAARCKICHSVAPIFDVVDLQKHCSFDNQYQYGLSGVQVPYFSCRRCGFLFATFFDDWTKRDWSRFVYNADYAKVDPEYEGARPERLARTMADTLRGCGGLRILDYGSGSGMFARCMHALGYQRVESYDPFSCPAKPEGRFDLVTCFEVLEHTLSPRDALREIKGYLLPGGCIVFSRHPHYPWSLVVPGTPERPCLDLHGSDAAPHPTFRNPPIAWQWLALGDGAAKSRPKTGADDRQDRRPCHVALPACARFRPGRSMACSRAVCEWGTSLVIQRLARVDDRPAQFLPGPVPCPHPLPARSLSRICCRVPGEHRSVVRAYVGVRVGDQGGGSGQRAAYRARGHPAHAAAPLTVRTAQGAGRPPAGIAAVYRVGRNRSRLVVDA